MMIQKISRTFFYLFIISSLSFMGCSKLAHLNELLTLKAISDEQASLKRLVEEQDKRFEDLLRVVKEEKLGEFPTKESILNRFGEPVFSRPQLKNNQEQEVWLYRYSTNFFGSEKVYFYFDQTGNLTEWEYIPVPAS